MGRDTRNLSYYNMDSKGADEPMQMHNLNRSLLLAQKQSMDIDKDLCLILNRRSYMSAHVLLNLLNELGKRDKMRGLLCILSLFSNEFNKFNNTRARIMDSIYHVTLRLL